MKYAEQNVNTQKEYKGGLDMQLSRTLGGCNNTVNGKEFPIGAKSGVCSVAEIIKD